VVAEGLIEAILLYNIQSQCTWLSAVCIRSEFNFQREILLYLEKRVFETHIAITLYTSDMKCVSYVR